MRNSRKLSILGAGLLCAALAQQTPVLAHGQDGEGHGMSHGMMDGEGYHGDGHHGDRHHDGGHMGGHHDDHMGGHMGGGMGYHMGGGMGQARTAALSLEEISVLMSAKLILMGNPRLNLGEVTAGDGDTAIVEIVTQEGSLVDKLAVDRWDLHMWRVE